MSLLIERVAFGGKGIGRLPSGKVCFVAGTIPGETVTVDIQREKSGYAEGSLVSIKEASPERVKAPCPVYGKCGGCTYQHITYHRQLVIKRDQVSEVLRRIGGVRTPMVDEVVPSPQEFGYRNRITVHTKRGRTGFYASRSRDIVDVSRCLIASDEVNEQLKSLRSEKLSDGERTLREEGYTYRGFRQVNSQAAELLAEIVSEQMEPGGDLLVDAYCGAGFFAKKLRPRFRQVIGIEWSADAVRAAREKVTDREIYLLGDVSKHLMPALAAAPASGTTLLLDPPAEGLDPSIPGTVLDRAPARIVYVSCDPSTLARDLKMLSSHYQLQRVIPVDMFPQTAEIEVVAVLQPKIS